ncbi:CBS domain-containing protein [archaeon]|nr:CBS domain-containing protein [archaeon]
MEKLSKIMIKKVVTGSLKNTIHDVAKKMKKYDISCVIITGNKKPIGIITEKDMAQKVVAKKMKLNDPVTKLMSKKLVTVNPDMNVFSSAKLMEKHNVKKLPVVKSGMLVAIVTQTDITRHYARERKRFVMKNLHLKKDLGYGFKLNK